jgi:hypothetical protein
MEQNRNQNRLLFLLATLNKRNKKQHLSLKDIAARVSIAEVNGITVQTF